MLKKAWRAVEESGVPESLQEVAFKEAVTYLRTVNGQGRTPPKSKDRDRVEKDLGDSQENAAERNFDRNDFFDAVAFESGADVDDLRQILAYDGEKVTVIEPLRKLGDTKTSQAQTVTMLVAGARHAGLGEAQVDASHARDESKRKNCYDKDNYSKHIGKVDGINLDAGVIHLGPRWATEFTKTVNRIVGKAIDDS